MTAAFRASKIDDSLGRLSNVERARARSAGRGDRSADRAAPRHATSVRPGHLGWVRSCFTALQEAGPSLRRARGREAAWLHPILQISDAAHEVVHVGARRCRRCRRCRCCRRRLRNRRRDRDPSRRLAPRRARSKARLSRGAVRGLLRRPVDAHETQCPNCVDAVARERAGLGGPGPTALARDRLDVGAWAHMHAVTQAASKSLTAFKRTAEEASTAPNEPKCARLGVW
jgi:hypothetical protein